MADDLVGLWAFWLAYAKELIVTHEGYVLENGYPIRQDINTKPMFSPVFHKFQYDDHARRVKFARAEHARRVKFARAKEQIQNMHHVNIQTVKQSRPTVKLCKPIVKRRRRIVK